MSVESAVLRGWVGYAVNSLTWSVITGRPEEFRADNNSHTRLPPGVFLRALTAGEIAELEAWDAASDEALHNFEATLD